MRWQVCHFTLTFYILFRVQNDQLAAARWLIALRLKQIWLISVKSQICFVVLPTKSYSSGRGLINQQKADVILWTQLLFIEEKCLANKRCFAFSMSFRYLNILYASDLDTFMFVKYFSLVFEATINFYNYFVCYSLLAVRGLN